MSSDFNPGSAKIYQFPVGGRAAVTGKRDITKSIDNPVGRIGKVPASSGWYHEAAVLEDERTPQ